MVRAIAFVFVFLLLAALAAGLGYFQFIVKPEMIKGFIAKAAPPPATVAVVEAKAETWEPRIPAIGTFKAVQGIDVAPQVGGVVRAIKFDSGQDVAKGAPLIEIDDAIEQADLQFNLATLKNASLGLDRQQQLTVGGNTSKASLDSAQATRDQSQAAVDRSRATIAQKAIAAPFAGRLGIRKVDVGQYVSPGTGVVTLQQLDPIFIDFPLPEQNVDTVKVGQVVEATVDAFGKRVFKGAIKSVDSRVDSATRNVLVRAEIPNPMGELKPGMFGNIDVIAGKPQAVVTLPRTGVTFSLYGDSIFVLKPAPAQASSGQPTPPAAPPAAGQPAPADPLIVERRFVRTGDTRGERVAISDGLAAGERVVSEGQLKLQPNQRVQVDTAPPAPLPTTLPRQ